MQQLRELLPQNLWQQMNRKLGQEEMLRLLWPALVGPRLAAQTYLKQLRGKTLVVAIPHREWRAPLESLEPTILESLRRFLGQSSVTSVELVVDEALDAHKDAHKAARPSSSRTSAESLHSPRATQQLGEVLPEGIPEAIEDEQLRETFLRSAQKYFDRPESPHRRELVR